MDICFMDYETFWSPTHSLTKMNPIEYVMHPDTEIQSLAIKWNNYPTDVFFGEDRIGQILDNHKKYFAENTMIVAHNGSGFDHLITSWRYGIKPKAWGCTLAMSRPFFGITVGGSLKKVSEALGVGHKGDLEAINTKGLRLAQFTPQQIIQMREYNKIDVELCSRIFYKLLPDLPMQEMKLIDMCVRMTVEPKFVADRELLKRTLYEVRNTKLARLRNLAAMLDVALESSDEDTITQTMRDTLMSSHKFSDLLERLGAAVPVKPSPSHPSLFIPALAKTDKEMQQLLEHEDERVALAAAVRLEHKSTQLETRLQTYLTVSDTLDGDVPMPLNYCGAYISWRMSGAMKMNVQNNPRVERHKKGTPLEGQPTDKPSNALRLSLKAPPGCKVVVVDSSNIELRVAHMLAAQHDVIDKLRNKVDLYCWFATMLFGREITKKDEDERFIGKVAMLSLQYGASWRSFQNMVRVLSGGAKDLPQAECERIVNLWRRLFPAIAGKGYGGEQKGIWKQCDTAIEAMAGGDTVILNEKLGIITGYERLITPNGHWLQYPKLRQITNPNTMYDEWLYGEGQNKSRIYGAHLFENLCLAGDVTVLTDGGWKPMIEVSAQDRVWDGEMWVRHAGLVYKGVKRTINFGGARMTPDHKVLVNGEWIEAQHTTYEKATASYRNAWYGEASRIRRISVYAGQVPAAIASGVSQLWRAGDYRLRSVAKIVYSFLEGHGRLVSTGTDTGSQEQQPGVQQEQLYVGYTKAAGTQPPQQHVHHDAVGSNARAGSAEDQRLAAHDFAVPRGEVAGGRPVQEAGQEKVESREEPVYDLMSAGPRHRFTVCGADGEPFIVHNCQHIARLIVMEQTLKLDKLFPNEVALSCHDEAVLVCPSEVAEARAAKAVEIFSTAPAWWPDIPLAADRGIGDTYGRAK